MKKFQRRLRSILRTPATGLFVVVALLAFGGIAAAQGSHPHPVKAADHHTSPVVHKTVAAAKPAAKPVTPPPTPAPTPGPTPTPQPAPKPAAVQAAAAVASTAASPGTSVSSLTPSPPPSPPPSDPTGSGSSSSTSSSGSSSTSTTSPTAYSSLNWAGYMAVTSGVTYTKVSGSWVAPTPTGNNSSTTADATWIGIGGVSSDDLIQTGTENTVSASGQVSTAVFYELLPDAPIYPTTISVTAGDSITASIVELSAGQWRINLSDITNGQSFTATVSYTSSHSSAEWIEEDPSYSSGQLVPFDSFGAASFSQASTTADGTAENLVESSASKVTLVSHSGTPRATPSDIGSDKASFSVTRN